MAVADKGMIVTSAHNFILNQYDGAGRFYFNQSRSARNLYSTCFGVLTSDLINGLGQLPENERNAISERIKSYQDSNSGYFIDREILQNTYGHHNLEYIKNQLTDFSIMALGALNQTPSHPLFFLEDYHDASRIPHWLENLDWKRPWLTSNRIMFILNFLLLELRQGRHENQNVVSAIMDWLDRNQDPRTGFWTLNNKVSRHNQMAAAYHFLIFFNYLRRPFKRIDKMIDSTLSIQDYDGLFDYSGGGGSCADVDAVYILCQALHLTDYRRMDIQKSLQRAHIGLHRMFNQDGGFCWAKRNRIDLDKIIRCVNPRLLFVSREDFTLNLKRKLINQYRVVFQKDRLTWKFSGLTAMKTPLNESDLWSTWFRLLALAMIESSSVNLPNKENAAAWKMRTLPGLGYYSTSRQ